MKDINEAIQRLGEQPQGVKVYLRGQSEMLNQTTGELSNGLLPGDCRNWSDVDCLFSISTIKSFSVICASWCVGRFLMLLLWLTGNTINIQSFMGCIMAVGVAVSNSILIVASAESIRKNLEDNNLIGVQVALSRFRPIIMTSTAMIAGMIPMSLGLGESGQQTAPLGIAVIGGLLFSTVISLWLVPLVYEMLRKKKQISVSLDPNDTNSLYYDKNI